MKYGYDIGLINKKEYNKFEKKIKEIEILKEILKSTKINPTEETNKYLEELESAKLLDSITLYDLLKRPEIEFENIKKYIEEEFDKDVIEQVVINIKYEGYISKENKEVEKMLEYEKILLSEDLDYSKVPNLAKEAVQKLNEIKPINVGQALRISGVNPADITMLLLYLKRNKNE
jgi:tRNA uridine 5-carboxymethylaminomethyl modification enzyme